APPTSRPVPVPPPGRARADAQRHDLRPGGRVVQRPLARRKAGRAAPRRAVRPARGRVAGPRRR
ncbi:MAG: hypothetical protein AVDCRST_MAG13-2524, partial [uncultured Solirubrobacteraceae bacterium]